MSHRRKDNDTRRGKDNKGKDRREHRGAAGNKQHGGNRQQEKPADRGAEEKPPAVPAAPNAMPVTVVPPVTPYVQMALQAQDPDAPEIRDMGSGDYRGDLVRFRRPAGAKRQGYGLVLTEDLRVHSFKDTALLEPGLDEARIICANRPIRSLNGVAIFTVNEAVSVIKRSTELTVAFHGVLSRKGLTDKIVTREDTETERFPEPRNGKRGSPLTSPEGAPKGGGGGGGLQAEKDVKRRRVAENKPESSPAGSGQPALSSLGVGGVTGSPRTEVMGKVLEATRLPIASKMQRESNAHIFRVMTYNVLAEWAAREYETQLYSHMTQTHTPVTPRLLWKHRKVQILEDLAFYQPDMIAMQELGSNVAKDFQNVLKQRGYSSDYAAKRGGKDGVMLAWKSSVFEALRGFHIIMKHPTNERLTKPQVSLVRVLCPKGTDRKVFFSSNHVYFHPSRGDVKCFQMGRVLEALSDFVSNGTAPAPELQSAWKEVHGSEPSWTSAHDTFRDTVDYVWLFEAKAVGTACPTAHTNARNVGLPCRDHGSDHLPVVCDVAISPVAGKSAIIAGDFNMVPNTALYSFMASGGKRKPHGDHRGWSGSLVCRPRAFPDQDLYSTVG